MQTKSNVLLVTRDPHTESAVKSLIDTTDHLDLAGVVRRVQDLATLTNPPSLVLVDIDLQPRETLRSLDLLVSRLIPSRFVVLSSKRSDDLVLEAMQAGARHILPKDSIPDSLIDILTRLLPMNGQYRGAQLGAITPILSVSGGSGATTVAVNLANELSLSTSEPVLLIDLDASYGAVAGYLGVASEYGIADILSGKDEIDGELLRSTAVSYDESLHVLLSPVSINFSHPAPLNLSRLHTVLQACKDSYRHTVIDASRVPLDAATDLVNESEVAVLTMQLNVGDIRLAKAMVTAIEERGGDLQRLLCLTNRFYKRRQLVTLDEAQRALPGLTINNLTNDFRNASAASNYGRPLARSAPRSILRREIAKLAKQICEHVVFE